jgi:hypothetical protein
MTLITFEDGKAVFRDGKVGTGQACCCNLCRCSRCPADGSLVGQLTIYGGRDGTISAGSLSVLCQEYDINGNYLPAGPEYDDGLAGRSFSFFYQEIEDLGGGFTLLIAESYATVDCGEFFGVPAGSYGITVVSSVLVPRFAGDLNNYAFPTHVGVVDECDPVNGVPFFDTNNLTLRSCFYDTGDPGIPCPPSDYRVTGALVSAGP